VSLTIVFAVAAHSEPEALVGQAENLATACPHSQLLVFDGASDPAWRSDVDLPFASRSRPLRHGYLSDFHYLVMQDALHRYPGFDCLVTLDSDILVIKSGLEAQLGELMKDFAYVGARLHPVAGRTEWSTARRFMYHWSRYWQPLLQVPTPWGAFNPGQVFRRDVVERIVADQSVPRLLDAARKARTTALEEIIYPSLVVGRGFAGTSHPGAHALTLRRYSDEELAWFSADPSVFLVHKVGAEPNAPDRQRVSDLAAGRAPIRDSIVPGASERISRTAGFRSLLRTGVTGRAS
jgi:hypothetical protein